MELHVLDWVGYIVGLCLLIYFMPEDFKEEMGILIGLFITMIFTVAWAITFSFYNIVDIMDYFNLVL